MSKNIFRYTDGQKSYQWAAMCFLALAANMSMLSEYLLLKKEAIISEWKIALLNNWGCVFY